MDELEARAEIWVGEVGRGNYHEQLAYAYSALGDHDRAIANRQDLVAPLVMKAKAADNALIPLQSRTPRCARRGLADRWTRRPSFLSAHLRRGSREGAEDADLGADARDATLLRCR